MDIDMMKYNTSILVDGCKKIGISLSDRQVEQFILFYRLLYEKNKVMNLTTVTEWDEVQTKHFLDSLLLRRIINLSEDLKIMDLGTGAGFPGIPLKIAFPDLNLYLADSLSKRVHFLEDVIKECNLKKIQVVHGRAEDLARDRKYRESFDVVVSRAVANLSSLSEYCLPFVKVGGQMISYKSAQIEKEMNDAERAIRILGGEKASVEIQKLPGTDVDRSFVIVQKKNSTPEGYPRKAGTPSRNPL